MPPKPLQVEFRAQLYSRPAVDSLTLLYMIWTGEVRFDQPAAIHTDKGAAAAWNTYHDLRTWISWYKERKWATEERFRQSIFPQISWLEEEKPYGLFFVFSPDRTGVLLSKLDTSPLGTFLNKVHGWDQRPKQVEHQLDGKWIIAFPDVLARYPQLEPKTELALRALVRGGAGTGTSLLAATKAYQLMGIPIEWDVPMLRQVWGSITDTAEVVRVIPDPPVIGHVYQETDSDTFWEGVKGTRIRYPWETISIPPKQNGQDLSLLDLMYPWGYHKLPRAEVQHKLAAMAAAVLGVRTPDQEAEEKRAQKEAAAALPLATCGVCFGRYAKRNALMVAHGYRMAAPLGTHLDSYKASGDCFGAYKVPWETSNQALREWCEIQWFLGVKSQLIDFLELLAGKHTRVEIRERVGDKWKRITLDDPADPRWMEGYAQTQHSYMKVLQEGAGDLIQATQVVLHWPLFPDKTPKIKKTYPFDADAIYEFMQEERGEAQQRKWKYELLVIQARLLSLQAGITAQGMIELATAAGAYGWTIDPLYSKTVVQYESISWWQPRMRKENKEVIYRKGKWELLTYTDQGTQVEPITALEEVLSQGWQPTTG